MWNIRIFAKYALSIVIGAGLMFALNRFFAIPTGVSGTDIQLGIPVLAVFSAVLGPVAGFLTGFIGHALVDLSWGGVWWSWVIASAFFGLAVGSFRKYFKIQAGGFGVKQALVFNAVQAAANIASYVFIARILDLLMYDEPFGKLTLQGFVAAGVNIAAVLILGTILAIGYSKTLTKTGRQKEEIEETEISYSKRINNLTKAIVVRLALGMFFISALMTLLISELVNRQTDNYRTTVIEVTGHHLTSAVTALSQLVSAEELDLFHTVEDMNKLEYEQIRERLIQFGEDNSVKYAYYWRDCGNGKFQYIVDNDTDPKTQVGPGDFNDIKQDAEREALAGNISVADLGSYSPGWEGLLSAYAPVFDREGNIYAVAGVDISDEFIFLQHQDAHKMTLLQLIVVPISVIFGILNMFLYRRKAKQIEEAHIKLQYFNNNLRRAFSTYLSEDVVEEIVTDPTRLQLGGIKRHMTAIFTDVRGFTGIAERLSPENLVDLLNHYLSTMSDAILEQKGTIDKYEGDAIIAFFGAPLELPDHAIKACTAAVIMKRLEADVNKYVMKSDISPSPLLTRIGINSGDMVVGNMGTQKKMNYTIISNAVNLAARLEGINKQYGTWILATENTIKETAGWFLTRRLDRIRVVGIKESVQIYEVLETMEDAPQALLQKVDLFHKALELFEVRRWSDAGKEFLQILKQYPDDGPAGLYVNRCRQFLKAEPLPDWDGVFNILEK
ncbi:MAG: ECF-type riboflavin transporter substrate-binding protein [Treponema sp.]|jgi:class 3 adenylate cyclase/uncharacterized membrane protein|nr:ECF-type riboflavin transporter substrate-binding protein [Treponema sp.]